MNNQTAINTISDEWFQEIKALETIKNWEEHTDEPCMVWNLDRKDRVVTKAETTYNLPFDAVVAYMSDPLLMKKMSKQVEKAELLHDDGDKRVVFIKMEGAGPVSSREVVAVNSIRQENSKKAYIGSRSIDYPCKFADPDSVRAELHVAGFIIEALDGGKTKVTSFNDIDLKGMIPGFIKNSMSKKRASNIVELEEKIRNNVK